MYERERVAPYLGALHTRGERFRLLALRATKVARVPTSIAVDYVFDRPDGLGFGKGLIDCASQRTWQWAMSPRTGALLALPCPQPPEWTRSGPIVSCTAGPNSLVRTPTFHVMTSAVRLPNRCKTTWVRRKVLSALSAFNLGLGSDFAQHFAQAGNFHPYTASLPGTGFSRRTRIATFVRFRYGAGDGWTARALLPPQGQAGLPHQAVYGLDLLVTYQGARIAEAGVKLVVDCCSGLLRTWLGPALALPPRA